MPKTIPSPIDTECEECLMDVVQGEEVTADSKDGYTRYTHVTCPTEEVK